MKRYILRVISLLVFLFGHTQNLSSQVSEAEVLFKEKNFPGKEAEFNKAIESYKKGDFYFLRGPVFFPTALEHYLVAQAFNPYNADLNYQIGLCYLNMQMDRLKSLPYLERARVLNPKLGVEFLYDLGRAYQYNLEFDKAIRVFEGYLTELKDKATPKQIRAAKKRIEECNNGKALVKEPVRVRITNLGPHVNSKFPDYAPVLSADENKLMFTSRREGTTGGMVDLIDSLFFEDIYITYLVDDAWAPAKNIGSPINKDTHDATINVSSDGKKLLIYRTENGGDIYESILNGIEWSEPQPIKEINTKWYENHAAYSPDGKTLYFISDRKDETNMGGKDIFIADISENGKFSNIRNAGEVLNTPYDEDGVFFHPDGKKLYFSSSGHNTMGGFDIFYSELENGNWTTPVNLGYPINTPEDDVFFVLSKDTKKAYFASYREEGYGDKDIYVMHFIDEYELLTSLQFQIRDTLAQRPLQASLKIVDIETGEVVVNRETDSGETIANLPAGKTYEITISSNRYTPYSEVLSIPFEASNQIVFRNVDLSADEQIHISGLISDKATMIPVPGELVFVDFLTNEEVKATITDKFGNYKIALPQGRKYAVQILAPGYSYLIDTVNSISLSTTREVSQNFFLNKIDRSKMSFLKGKIADANTASNIANYNLSITELGGQPILTYPKSGKYDCVVFNGTVVNLQVEAEGYLTYNARLEVPSGDVKSNIDFDIFMSKAELGMKIVLNNIFFDFNKATLRPVSYKSLKNLLNIMRRYPLMQIEVSGHTDNIGNVNYNQTLSENRAMAVKEYLVRNGIAESRVTSVGKSFKEPIASNDSNEGRQLNRRTEIRITKVK